MPGDRPALRDDTVDGAGVAATGAGQARQLQGGGRHGTPGQQDAQRAVRGS